MKVGVVKEIKPQENRVGLTPSGAKALVRSGHTVLVEPHAGEGSGYSDGEYESAGAQMANRAALFESSDMIVKVKEPLAEEYSLLRSGQILFTYLHLAPARELTEALLVREVIGIAYETMQDSRGHLPLLTPMSQVAGRMSIQIGAQYLEAFYGGKGILLGGVPGVPSGHVVVIGAGVVGTNAIAMAVGLGARVTVLDVSVEKLNAVHEAYRGRVATMVSTLENLAEIVPTADLLVGAVLIPGARAPRLVTEQMVKEMRKGSVIVDVAIDQGGVVATCDRLSTHADPIYLRHSVLHYAVPNMPGAVPRTSTIALTNVTLPFVQRLANRGIDAIGEDSMLSAGVNLFEGHVTNPQVADALRLPYAPLSQFMGKQLSSNRLA
ncbi:MAG: alanine dehydrogenase [Bacilli bacterium]